MTDTVSVQLEDIVTSKNVQALIRAANTALGVLGYTEHGERHAHNVAASARKILESLGFPPRTCELAAISGYLHDIGNVVNRDHHGHSSALLAYDLLKELGMPIAETALIMTAIGNHEDDGKPVSELAAAIIIGDKCDVNRSRVRNRDPRTFDIHDRVNYAVTSNHLEIDGERRIITLNLTVDATISSIMDYFGIFLERMTLTRESAFFLDCSFRLIMNGIVLETQHVEREEFLPPPQFE